MFEDVSDEQLAKYDKFLMDMSELAQKQSVVLQDIKVWISILLSSLIHI